ncbi:phosphoribulokinase, partial [Bacillus thuringiensis]
FMHSYSQRFDIIIKTSDETICIEKNTFEFYKV